MRTICFYFQVHQPFRLKKYRFFEIGEDHYYYDDYSNRQIIKKVAEKCYLPANKMMLDLINEYGKQFKIAFSLSGTFIEQMELYAPDVLESFKKLADTGCVEFLSETYSHSLASLINREEFIEQVEKHREKIQKHFNQTPTIFRNTELIYSDTIGEMVGEMGFKAMLTEGAKHILGWKSPNYLYYNANNPRLKILLKNFKLSDDIAFRFSNKSWEAWPLTADKFVNWLNLIPLEEEIVNLFMDYETFGEHQWEETGIFEFFRTLPKTIFQKTNFAFGTPTDVAENYQPKAAINVPFPISWADVERDLTAWLGNEMQDEAFEKLYKLKDLIFQINDENLTHDWRLLQTSDHFYYMCTKFFSDGDVHSYFNPYNNPYDAFINYMNVLNDFAIRVKEAASRIIPAEEISAEDIDRQINKYEVELKKLRLKAEKLKTPIVSGQPKPRAIEKTKAQAKAIDKTKPKLEAIESPKDITLDINGIMTVASLRKLFNTNFGLDLIVYNGTTINANKIAESNIRLSKISKVKKGIAAQGPIIISEKVTIAEFEKTFRTKYGIAVQVTNATGEIISDKNSCLI